MEKIKFTIWDLGTGMCRITSNDCRTEVKRISDGACIGSLDILLEEMKRITSDMVDDFEVEAVFAIG